MLMDTDDGLFIGTYDVQECKAGEGEAALPTYKETCQKNSGHNKFVPVNNFAIENLPQAYHNHDLYKFIKSAADLTVMITVTFTSPNRPEFVPGTTDPYPCYNTRGQNSLRTGTGRVTRVIKYTDKMIDKKMKRNCPCPMCKETPNKNWLNITVNTARYVVYDSSEAKQSKCRLWFDDDEGTPVEMYGWDARASETSEDLITLSYATHNLNIYCELKDMILQYTTPLLYFVFDHYKTKNDAKRLTIIVSHPHGCSKQVSVGHWVQKRSEDNDDITRYTYTTCTCPGSCGAQVYLIGGTLGANCLHLGTNADGLGFSGSVTENDTNNVTADALNVGYY